MYSLLYSGIYYSYLKFFQLYDEYNLRSLDCFSAREVLSRDDHSSNISIQLVFRIRFRF